MSFCYISIDFQSYKAVRSRILYQHLQFYPCLNSNVRQDLKVNLELLFFNASSGLIFSNSFKTVEKLVGGGGGA